MLVEINILDINHCICIWNNESSLQNNKLSEFNGRITIQFPEEHITPWKYCAVRRNPEQGDAETGQGRGRRDAPTH
jgi:hypothetical protein